MTPASILSAARIRGAMWWDAAGSLGVLAAAGWRAWRSGQGVGAALTAPDSQRRVFALLRAAWPNLVLSRRLVAAYENRGTAIVTRQTDVTEVLEREADFAVVYEPRMRRITAGENFFLGMQDSPAYTRDVSLMRLAVRREDVPRRVLPFVAERAEAIVAASGGRLDVAADLTRRVPAALALDYFGAPACTEDELIEWCTVMFWWLFADLAASSEVERQAVAAAGRCRGALEAAIAARKAAPGGEDVLARCLALQAAGVDGMDDGAIRDNLIGLLIGLVPTLSKAAVLALSQLLDRPEALAGAQAAARRGDDTALAAHVFEALRFEPVNPVIYRRAVRDTVIARGTLRARRVPKDTLVFAANLSAMFDPLAVEQPERFRTDRPWGVYMLWGYGMHSCFGGEINRAVVPALLKPLLARSGLRRAGPVDGAGTPFPVSFPVTFD